MSQIKESWSLLAFARVNGRMQVGKFTNGDTGEQFSSCIFSSGDDKKFVYFSSSIGELSPSQIVARKNELQVVLSDEGKYYLCKVGDPGKAWQDVDLF